MKASPGGFFTPPSKNAALRLREKEATTALKKLVSAPRNMSDARAFMRGERARPEAFRRKMKAGAIAVPAPLLPALYSVSFRR